MPFTITLTDEQAYQLVAQVSAGLVGKSFGKVLKEATPPSFNKDLFGKPIKAASKYRNAAAPVYEYVHKLAVGEQFKNAQLFYATEKSGAKSTTVNNVLQHLKNDGVVKLIKRGTWQKIA